MFINIILTYKLNTYIYIIQKYEYINIYLHLIINNIYVLYYVYK